MSKRIKVQVRSDAGKRGGNARDLQKESYWRKHAVSWRASGLSKRGYSTQHDLPYWSFLSWLREIELRDKEKNRPAEPTGVLSDPEAQNGNPFVPIRIISAKTTRETERRDRATGAAVRQSIEIELPSGAVIRLHDGCDPDFVAKLLGSMKS